MTETQPAPYFFVAPLAEDFSPTFQAMECDLQSAFLRFKESGRDLSLPYAVFRGSELIGRISSVYDRKAKRTEPKLEEWPRRWWKKR